MAQIYLVILYYGPEMAYIDKIFADETAAKTYTEDKNSHAATGYNYLIQTRELIGA